MIAVRLTNHKTVSKLCELSQTALISTSANLSETPYDNDINKIKNIFKNKVDGIVQGKLGNEKIINYKKYNYSRNFEILDCENKRNI